MAVSHHRGHIFRDDGILFLRVVLYEADSTLCSRNEGILMNVLTELGHKYGSDKVLHGYTEFYPLYLEPMRPTATRVLELGVLGGSSLLMWQDYFEKAEIVGVDIDLIRNQACGPRITTRYADLGDAATLHCLAEETWDVIIDDASHRPEHQILAFSTLFPSLKSGGIYICEDTQTQFQSYYGGAGPHDVHDFFTGCALELQGCGIGGYATFTPEEESRTSEEAQALRFIHFWRYCVIAGRK
jgi:hypothetical protein